MLEVEAKVKVEAAVVRARLAALGVILGPVVEQNDTFFQPPARDFAATDEALRLRRVGADLELTYKGPRHGRDKSRIEETVRLQGDPTPLLAALGFRPVVGLVKRRALAAWRGVDVCLDHVEGLGDFVEVEAHPGPDAQTHIDAALAALGLADAPRIRDSYLELALRAGSQAARRV